MYGMLKTRASKSNGKRRARLFSRNGLSRPETQFGGCFWLPPSPSKIHRGADAPELDDLGQCGATSVAMNGVL